MCLNLPLDLTCVSILVQLHCLGLVYSEAIWSLKTKLKELYGYDDNTSHEILTRLTYLAAGHVSTWYSGQAPFGGCSPGSGYLNFLIADDTDGDLTNGTPHFRAIYEAFNDLEIACNSPRVIDSGCNDTPVRAPLVYAKPGQHEITLTWNSVPSAVSYEVFRSEGPKGCDMGKIKLGDIRGTFFIDTGLVDGLEYYYIVIAKSSGSCFGPSSQCVVATPTPPQSVHINCEVDTVVLNLLNESPHSELECTIEALSGYKGTAELECVSKTNNTVCAPRKRLITFTDGDTSSKTVTLDVSTLKNVETSSEVLVTLTDDSQMKKVTSIPIWLVEYGEPQSAQSNSIYMAPTCDAPGRYCSSETLLEGRGRLGPELNAPNTLYGSCADGRSGTYKVDESIEKIIIRSGDVDEPAGRFLTRGEIATIEATVFAYGTGLADRADFYYASDVSDPEWIWITTLTPSQGGGLVTLKASYTIPMDSINQAVRVHYRYGGTTSPCSANAYSEADDLVFTTLPLMEERAHSITTIPTASPVSSPSQSPAAGGTLATSSAPVLTNVTKGPTVSPLPSPSNPAKRPTPFPSLIDASSNSSPTQSPTTDITSVPSHAPSNLETDEPTASPATSPSSSPIRIPTNSPSIFDVSSICCPYLLASHHSGQI